MKWRKGMPQEPSPKRMRTPDTAPPVVASIDQRELKRYIERRIDAALTDKLTSAYAALRIVDDDTQAAVIARLRKETRTLVLDEIAKLRAEIRRSIDQDRGSVVDLPALPRRLRGSA